MKWHESKIHSFNRYAYASNSSYTYVDTNGRNAVTAFGGLLVESYNAVMGKGFDIGKVQGALADGYNGEGAGFASSLYQDAESFIPIGAIAGALVKSAKLANVAFKKKEVNAAREAAKEQFRKESTGLETKVIRSGRDGAGKVAGVGTTKRKGPTYRPKGDGSYSVGRPGKVKHFRPDGQGGLHSG